MLRILLPCAKQCLTICYLFSDDAEDTITVRQAVFDDLTTSRDTWLAVIKECQKYESCKPICIELLAAVTVMGAIRTASKAAQERQSPAQYVSDPHIAEEEITELEQEGENEDEKHNYNSQ